MTAMAGRRLPREFLDELLLRTDIVEVIDARVPLRKAGKEYKACCPFHQEKTPSFTVSPDKQFYHCFGCGAHGTAITFLMEYERMSFREAVAELAARVGLRLPAETAQEAEPGSASTSSTDLVALLEEAARFYRRQLREHPRAAQAVAYLKDRGLTGEIAAAFGLGYAPDGWDSLVRALGTTTAAREALVRAGLAVKKEHGGCYDRFRHRIMFPIHDARGRIVGFGGRVLGGEGEPKYLNSPETALFHKGRELYGLYRARDAIRREGRVLLVEGYMDVVALAQHGIDFAVATLGTAATRDHLERLYRYAPEVVVAFDGDRAGREAAWRALEVILGVMQDGRQASFLFLPEGEDPDSLVRKEGREAFLARLEQARPLPDFFIEEIKRRVQGAGRRLDARARLVELARPLLSKMQPGALRRALVDRVADFGLVSNLELTRLIEGQIRVSARQRGEPRGVGTPKDPPSTLRLAIAMLVQYPQLAAKATLSWRLDDPSDPGLSLLGEVIDLIRSTPRINTAAIVEHFRDSNHIHTISRLAAWEHPALMEPSEADLAALLDKLRRDAIKGRVDKLLMNQKNHGLRPEEVAELKRLLDEKRRFEKLAPQH
jgi:DNA primase